MLSNDMSIAVELVWMGGRYPDRGEQRCPKAAGIRRHAARRYQSVHQGRRRNLYKNIPNFQQMIEMKTERRKQSLMKDTRKHVISKHVT